MYILRASWKISFHIYVSVCVYAKCCNPRKIKTLLTYLLTYYIQNMKALGLVVSEKIFLCFSHDTPGAGTVWTKVRVTKWRTVFRKRKSTVALLEHFTALFELSTNNYFVYFVC